MPIDKRKIPEVNASSQADIAFMLLIFFLVATSMDTDLGIPRMLPPLPDENKKTEDMDIKERNLLTVYINAHNQIMVAGKRVHDVKDVKEIAMEYILNVQENEDMPEKVEKDFELPNGRGARRYAVSSCIISLRNDRSTEYGKYLEVQDALMGAFREIRDDLSKSWFGKSFGLLNEDEKKVVTEAVPLKISESEPRDLGGKK